MRNIAAMVWARVRMFSVEDLVEHGLVELVHLLRAYDPSKSELLTYLYPRLRGVMLDEHRRTVRRKRLLERVRFVEEEVPAVSEEQLDIKRAVARLHPRDRDMFLRVQAGYEVQEAGRVWGVSKTRASRIVHRAECIVRDHCR